MSMGLFQDVPVQRPDFSTFNLTHENKLSMEFGDLVPIQCIECVPNDTFELRTEAFIRLAPMKFPVMHRINCKIYHFFVPTRIIWHHWKKFIAERPDDSLPAMICATLGQLSHANIDDGFGHFDSYNDIPVGSLPDYMGLPARTDVIDEECQVPFNVLPFLAYQKIYNDYFRDQNFDADLFADDAVDGDDEGSLYMLTEHEGIINDFDNSLSDGVVFENLFTLRKKRWEKDYFTSALPDPQFGDIVPIDIFGSGSTLNVKANAQDAAIGGPNGVDIQGLAVRQGNNYDANAILGSFSADNLDLTINSEENLNALNMLDLRLAAAVQRYQELLARAGHRYKEFIQASYGEVVPDYRLDRPQFIASGEIPVVVSDIPQTSQSTDNSALGELGGKGTAVGADNFGRVHCYEHGYIISIACVLPRTAYMNGLPRMFSHLDRFDYHHPMFEKLGEQEILNKEVYVSDDPVKDNGTFGYAPRYAEYKFINSSVHGEFRTSLDFMHMARKFAALPQLGSDFLSVSSNPSDRAFAVSSETSSHHLYCQFLNHVKAVRPMAYNPIPALI